MVRALEQEQENYRSRLYHFKGMSENLGGRHSKSLSVDENTNTIDECSMDDKVTFRSQASRHSSDQSLDKQEIGSVFSRNDKAPKSRLSKDEPAATPLGKDRQNLGK